MGAVKVRTKTTFCSMKRNPSLLESDDPDRFLRCQEAMEDVFRTMAAKAIGAGWHAEEVADDTWIRSPLVRPRHLIAARRGSPKATVWKNIAVTSGPQSSGTRGCGGFLRATMHGSTTLSRETRSVLSGRDAGPDQS
jgi:hypothetical protein